jgi:hypothetical protein
MLLERFQSLEAILQLPGFRLPFPPRHPVTFRKPTACQRLLPLGQRCTPSDLTGVDVRNASLARLPLNDGLLGEMQIDGQSLRRQSEDCASAGKLSRGHGPKA